LYCLPQLFRCPAGSVAPQKRFLKELFQPKDNVFSGGASGVLWLGDDAGRSDKEERRIQIGKNERGRAVPSIEATKKIGSALGVTLDYLVKDSEYKQVDYEMLKRLKKVQGLDDENRAHNSPHRCSHAEEHCSTVDTKKPNLMKDWAMSLL